MNKISFIQRLRNKFKIKGIDNIIEIDKNVRISGCKIFIKGYNNKLIIKNQSSLRNVLIEIIGNNCFVEIGKYCVIGENSYISAKEENTCVIIKNNCMFSRNIKIMTSNGHPIYLNNERLNKAGSIYIGNHVWLADNVTILKNVKIEDNSIIGINSTVTKNIPWSSIAAGNPAKIIKENITWEN